MPPDDVRGFLRVAHVKTLFLCRLGRKIDLFRLFQRPPEMFPGRRKVSAVNKINGVRCRRAQTRVHTGIIHEHTSFVVCVYYNLFQVKLQ